MLEVIYEDNHIIAINKKSGDIVQGDKTGDKPLLEIVKQYIKEKYNKPGDVFLGCVHRLDRPTSGIVLFARTSKALARLNKMFQNKEIKKNYWAIVEQPPIPATGNIVSFLKKNEKQNKSFSSNTPKDGYKKAELSYKTLCSSENYCLVEIEPKTGRHHQIRVQLSSIGSIIKGDLKYGAKRSNKDASICLLARKIEFIHPVKKEKIILTARVPKDRLWEYFEKEVKQ